MYRIPIVHVGVRFFLRVRRKWILNFEFESPLGLVLLIRLWMMSKWRRTNGAEQCLACSLHSLKDRCCGEA